MSENIPNITCEQCGMCCSIYYLNFTDNDLKTWKKMVKNKIYPNPISDRYVDTKDPLWKDGFYIYHTYRPSGYGGKVCPYLMYQPHYKKFICRLHKQGKPEVCKNFICHRKDRKII
jgi:hypothetical protein